MDANVYKWMADYTEGSIGEKDFRYLKEWIDKAPENRAVFEDYLRIYKEAHEIGFMTYMESDRSWKMLERKLKRRVRMRVVRFMVAASILLGGVMGGWLFSSLGDGKSAVPVATSIPGNTTVMLRMADGKNISLRNNEVWGLVEKDGTEIRKDSVNELVYLANSEVTESVLHTVEVPVGGEFNLTLSDGTHVWLNSDTKLRFPTHFIGNKREVYVTGEAFFSVKKDAEHPFIVHTDGAHVCVLGTTFNLSAYPGEKMITTLAQGNVEVTDGWSKVHLQPGEQATWRKGARYIEVKNVDVSLYTSWIKGVFEFENMSLLEISKQLSRWYGVEFHFEEEDCAQRRFTGGIKKYVPLCQSLDIIEKTTNVNFRIRGKEVVVKSH